MRNSNPPPPFDRNARRLKRKRVVKLSFQPQRNSIRLAITALLWWVILAGVFILAASIAVQIKVSAVHPEGALAAGFAMGRLLVNQYEYPTFLGALALSIWLTFSGRLPGARLPERRNVVVVAIVAAIWWFVLLRGTFLVLGLLFGVHFAFLHLGVPHGSSAPAFKVFVSQCRWPIILGSLVITLALAALGQLPGTRK